MKLTKFAQSCIMLESEGQKVLIDPGFILVNEQTIQAWKNPDFILVTHKHQDHFDEASVKKIISSKTKIFATKETAEQYPNVKFEIIEEGETFSIGKIKVNAVKAVHGYNPKLKGGKLPKEGVGFILETKVGKIYHTGDTICFENNYKCDILLLPFNNHGVCMGIFEAALFAKDTGAKLVIPIHYDNPIYPANRELMKKELEKNGLNCRNLDIMESIEL